MKTIIKISVLSLVATSLFAAWGNIRLGSTTANYNKDSEDCTIKIKQKYTSGSTFIPNSVIKPKLLPKSNCCNNYKAK